jgi:RING-box protein 1
MPIGIAHSVLLFSLSPLQDYGLKLRGSHTFDLRNPAPASYSLELKIRKHGGHHGHGHGHGHQHAAAARDADAMDEGEHSSSASSSTAASALPSPEEWKKVIHGTPISCTPSGLTRAVLSEVELVFRTTPEEKKRKKELLGDLTKQLQAKRDTELAAVGAAASAASGGAAAASSASGSHTVVRTKPYEFVQVKKSRCKLSKWGAEQTDVEVKVLSSGGAAGGETWSFRSICFEGKTEDVLARGQPLFTYLLTSRNAAANASAATSSSAAGPSRLSPLIAGYPEFLLRCLTAMQQGASAAAPAAQGQLSSAAAASSTAPTASSSVSSASSSLAPGAKRVELKKWSAVSLWSWDIEVDNCAICRNLIMEYCIECQANRGGGSAAQGVAGAGYNDECTVAWGVCNHAFHFRQRSRQDCDSPYWLSR